MARSERQRERRAAGTQAAQAGGTSRTGSGAIRSAERSASQRRAQRRGSIVKGLLLFAALVACGLPVLLIASPISYIPLIAVLLLVGASWLYLHILKRSFDFSEEQMARSCERGTTVRLNVTLMNKSILPHPAVEVSFCISDLFEGQDAVRHLNASLGSRQTSTFSFDAQFSHVGRYSVGIDSVVLHDLIGLFSARIDRTLCRQVVVRPRLFDFALADLSESSESAAQMMRAIASTDSIDYSSVREYRYGDPLKAVHWNLTSRSVDRTMYTRLYEEYVSPSLSIILDPFSDVTSADDLMSSFDGIVESAGSLARFAESQGVECLVRYASRSYEYATTRLNSVRDTEELVLSAQRITSVGEHRPEAAIPLEVLAAEVSAQQRAGNVAFVTGRIDQDIIALLGTLAANRIRPLLVLCLPSSFVGPARKKYLAPLQQLSRRNIGYFVMESSETETRAV